MTKHAGNPATNWHDVLERAGWTAAQAFLGAISAAELSQAVADVDLSSLEALALSGLGAAVAAVASFIKTLAQERLKRFDTRA